MKNKTIIIGIIAFLITAVIVWTCARSTRNSGQQTIDSLQLRNQQLDSLVSTQGKVILEQKTILVDNTKALDNLTDTIFDLKKKDQKNASTIAYYKGTTVTKLVHIPVPYRDSLAVHQFYEDVDKSWDSLITYMNDSMMPVPRTAILTNDTFSITATVTKNALLIDSLSIPDTLQLRFVQRSKFLSSPTVEVQFFHSNPLITTTQSNSVTYKPKQKNGFLRWAIPIVVGAGVGILMAK